MKPQEKVVPEPRGRKAVSPAVFRVKEQAVTAAGARPKRANMGGTADIVYLSHGYCHGAFLFIRVGSAD